jgi:flagellar M-ring protein FliF
VARSQQSVTENSRSQEPQNVSVANNLPGAEAGSGGGTQESRQEETTNFEIGRTVRNILREQPVLRRLSVGVLVDGVTERRDGQSPQFRERTAEELARIATLVRSAVGFNEQRGDRVEVVSMRFAEPEPALPDAPGLFGLGLSEALVARLAETALIGLLALLALFLVARPVARRLSLSLAPASALAGAGAAGAALEGGAAGVMVAGGTPGGALPGAEGAGALPSPADGEEMINMASVRGQMRASSIAKIVKLTEEHPDEALLVLRRWLTPEDDA